MKPGIVALTTALGTFFLGISASATDSDQANCDEVAAPHQAVKYWEMPTGGPNFETGRQLLRQSHNELGVDLNSWVRLVIDTPCLAKLLASAAQDDDAGPTTLALRVDYLTSAVNALGAAVEPGADSSSAEAPEGTAEALDLGLSDTEEVEAANAILLVHHLLDARRLRLGEFDPDSARARSLELPPLVQLAEAPGSLEWRALGDLLNEELEATYDDLEARRVDGARLLVVARLIGKGDPRPIRLSGLNDVKTGPFSPVGTQAVDITVSAPGVPGEQGLKEAVSKTKAKGAKAVATAEARRRTSEDPTEAEDAGEDGPGEAAAKLSPPPGQRAPRLADGKIVTSFNLATISDARAANDVVRVQYAIVRQEDDDTFEVIGPEWEDNFTLRQFGLQQTLSGGFAFVQQEGTSDWKPTAVANYTLGWRKWPKAPDDATDVPLHDRGRRVLVDHDYFSGLGLSLLTPDFDDEQDFEIGLGIHTSFLANRVTLGYGVNLSADEDRDFLYFSVNLFKSEIFDKVAKLAKGSGDAGK